ncbi:hypothetical protein FOPG_19300 [Fusarium oxysporum f. sp. conglutinans race 2 54008]|uniref:CENP-V/GFA domain-containing protein n=1 Tax=Fusarium oxysporum f. sp. conglutinans race 2 54008 TaxID=1089457 RepID=X0GLG4_FUSOX|nr:hypothetical protein FOPG_19300 [Fusarium oxysporum f. sp. conglutinans race 2 54008]
MHQISCLCGSISQQVSSQTPRSDNTIGLSLCHCDTCRHATGLLCTSYLPIGKPNLTHELSVFNVSDVSSRYFCSTCGCHIYRSHKGDNGEMTWGVATGVISGSDDMSVRVRYAAHTHVADTVDGGASIWIPPNGQQGFSHSDPPTQQTSSVDACCACGGVKLRITRPNETSHLPRRNYTDLIHPYCSTDEFITTNPSDEKWWIQGDKYLAGTCACKSCRLVSGFEVQTWAFVPRANISIFAPGDSGLKALDFEGLPAGDLKSYQSSGRAVRDFCGGCGATVFWRDVSDSSVIDVSVGLLRAEEGARAESWLYWWTDRVSFSEEVQTHRSGPFAAAAQTLVDKLSLGMKAGATGS